MKNFFKNRDNLIILFVSLVAFIAGFLAIGFVKSFIIVLVFDLLLFIPSLISKIKNKEKTEKKKPTEKKEYKWDYAKEEVPVKKKKQKSKKGKIIKRIILFILLGIVAAIIIGIIVFGLYIASTAPEFKPEALYKREPSIIYAGDEVIANLGAEKRENITYDDLPEVLIDAIIATEDSRFFQHNGFDLSRFLVASTKQVLTGGGGGASTLTMQIVKNIYTSDVSSGFEGIKRKFTDIYMAVFQVEKKYTKKEILEFYVNSFYLGDGAYGVEQASYNYFGKDAKDLNLAEAALIAGLFQAPNAYDPKQNPEKAEQRRNQVLALMKRHKYITDEEYKVAKSIKVEDMLIKHEGSYDNEWQPFIDVVIQDVIDVTGISPYEQTMKIYATMDKDKQRHVNDIMNGTTYQWPNDLVDAGIAVTDVNTGAILAIGAGRHRVGQRQYVTATQIKKQIGSTSKPLYDYAPGIEFENWSTYKLFKDEPYTYSDGTSIYNWDRGYNGLMTMRTAMAQSRNVPALKAFQQNKNSNILKFVQSLGLHPEVGSNGLIHEAHAIGGYTGECPLTMAAAYAAFGNGGYYIKPYSFSKIVMDSGEVIETKVEKKKVMSEETAYMMTSLLQSSAQLGLGYQYNIGGAIYGAKTGTSNYDEDTIRRWGLGADAVNDLWVDGVSPDYAISVWYGYKERNEENYGVSSNSYTINHRTLFQAVARGVFKNGSNWTKPNGVNEVEVEFGTWPAALASESTPQNLRVTELFKAGTEPTETSAKYAKLPNVTNLTGSLSGNRVTLKWNAVKVSNTDNEFSNENLGEISYYVYNKNSDGSLNKLVTTTESVVTFEVNASYSNDFIVKTVYSNYPATASEGASVVVNLNGLRPKTTVTLTGVKEVTLDVGDEYKLSSSDVKVIDNNNKDVTKDATVKITINDKVVSEVDTTKAGDYTVKYTVTYNKETTELTRRIIVKERAKDES